MASSREKTGINISNLVDINYLKTFFGTSSSLLQGSLINTLTYSSASKIASIVADGGLQSITHIAAHQIVMQIWWFLSFFSSPLSLVAQAVLPRDIVAKRVKRANKLTIELIKVGTILASLCTLVNGVLLMKYNHIFTKNTVISDLSKTVIVPTLISQFVICITTILDGIFIGNGLLSKYNTACIIATCFGWLFYGFTIWKGTGITGTWNALLAFSISRLVYYLMNIRNIVRTV